LKVIPLEKSCRSCFRSIDEPSFYSDRRPGCENALSRCTISGNKSFTVVNCSGLALTEPPCDIPIGTTTLFGHLYQHVMIFIIERDLSNNELTQVPDVQNLTSLVTLYVCSLVCSRVSLVFDRAQNGSLHKMICTTGIWTTMPSQPCRTWAQ
jgi:hypothetical protein